MNDAYTIHDKAAREALALVCWRALNAKDGLTVKERTRRQKRILTFGETGDVKNLDGLQDVMPLYDTIAEYDRQAATALEGWVRVNNPPAPPRPWPPVERATPTFQHGQRVRVATTHKHYGETGRVDHAEATDVGGLVRERVWVKFDSGECPVSFQDFQLEAV